LDNTRKTPMKQW